MRIFVVIRHETNAIVIHDILLIFLSIKSKNNLSFVTGAYLTMETSLAIDMLPKDYDDGPSGGNAQLLGIWGVAAFLGSAIGPMIGGPLLYLFGSSGVVDGQDYTIQGYTIILSLSTAYFILSAISLKWLKKTDV
jgi:MFS family permease